MANKTMLLAAALCAVALAGCTGGDSGSSSNDGSSTSTTGGVGVGGNVTAGNTTVSGSFTATGTGSGNVTENETAPMAQSVSIEGNQFVNQSVTVRVGGTVTWTHNDGAVAHTVTSDDGSFDSSPNCSPTVPPLPPTGDCMTQGETFAWTFAAPGTYAYHCKVHGTAMTGTVTVVS